MTMNFESVTTENLVRYYKRQRDDLTETVEQEIRRMYIIQALVAEFQKRGMADQEPLKPGWQSAS